MHLRGRGRGSGSGSGSTDSKNSNKKKNKKNNNTTINCTNKTQRGPRSIGKRSKSGWAIPKIPPMATYCGSTLRACFSKRGGGGGSGSFGFRLWGVLDSRFKGLRAVAFRVYVGVCGFRI